ncbi:MAG: peroxiredoxin [Spirochaetaceae bacterium]|nr:peroxiredoxin [Spirochaetaceae bacterium]
MSPSVGEDAPDFELMDQHGQTVRLSDLRGHKAALVVFYPWAFTGVCGGELHAMQAELDELVSEQVALFTVSTDSMYALRTFADQEGFTFPLLSDFWPHGAVAQAYGVLHPEIGVALRGTFLVDRDGVVRWSVVNGISDARDISAYKDAVAALGSGVRG